MERLRELEEQLGEVVGALNRAISNRTISEIQFIKDKAFVTQQEHTKRLIEQSIMNEKTLIKEAQR